MNINDTILYNAKECLAFLENASKGKGIERTNQGLCGNFECETLTNLAGYINNLHHRHPRKYPDSVFNHGIQASLYVGALRAWPYFNGSYAYPIPNRAYPGMPGVHAYYRAELYKTMWDTDYEYGRLRLHFTTHIFKLAQRLTVAKYLQLLGDEKIEPDTSKTVCDNVYAIAGIGVRNAFADQRNYYRAVESYRYYSGNPDYPVAKMPELWCRIARYQRLEFARHMSEHLYNDIKNNLYIGGPISEN